MFSLVETIAILTWHVILARISASEKISGRILTPGRRPQRAGLTIRDGRIESVGRSRLPGGLDFGDALLLPGAVDVHVHTRSYAERGDRALHARGRRRRRDDDRRHALRRRRADRQRSTAFEAKVARRRARGARRRRAVGDGSAARADRGGRRRSSTPARRRSSSRPSRPTRSASRGSPTASCWPRSRAIAAAGGLAGVHAENDEIVRAGIAAEQAAGHGGDPLAHARSRPPVAEHEAIARVLELARATGVRLHVCHVSTPRGVELVAAARARRRRRQRRDLPALPAARRVRAARRGGEAKINPPLRAHALPADGLDLISSDHVGWPARAQARRRHLRPGLGRPRGRADRAAGPRRARAAAELVRLVSEAPARRFGLWPRKGNLQPGRRRRPARARPRRSSGRSTRRAGHRRPAGARTRAGALRGRVIAAFSRGVQVWDGRRVLAAPGHGRFVAARPRRRRGRAPMPDTGAALPRLAPGGDPAPAREQPGDRRGPRAPGRLRRPRQGGPRPRQPRARSSPRCARSRTARRWSSSRASRSRSCPPARARPPCCWPTATSSAAGRPRRCSTSSSAADLIAWGGLTAGCWQYIGSQGVLQGTYETFAQVAREHFGGSLRRPAGGQRRARRDGRGAADRDHADARRRLR